MTTPTRGGIAGHRSRVNGTALLGPGRTGAEAENGAPRRRRRLTGRQAVALALLALLLIGLGGVGGWAASRLVTPTYAAHADILYAISTEQPTGFLREDRNITTQLVLLDSRSVLGPVAAESNVSVQSLAERLDASVVEGSEVIRLTLTDPDPDRAQRLLTAVVARYTDVSSDDARAELRAYIDAELTDILGRISEARTAAEDRAWEMGALVEREQWLRRQLNELEFSTIAGPAVSVLVEPYVDPAPLGHKPLLMTAAGASTGLLLALLVVALAARRMTRS